MCFPDKHNTNFSGKFYVLHLCGVTKHMETGIKALLIFLGFHVMSHIFMIYTLSWYTNYIWRNILNTSHFQKMPYRKKHAKPSNFQCHIFHREHKITNNEHYYNINTTNWPTIFFQNTTMYIVYI